jgi:ADP-ribosylglycohydrolase
VHPGVASLWEFHQAADPARIATAHDGCGAAIRVAPVGVLYPSDRLEALVEGAREASISTHGGVLAIAAAAATAAAVSAAIDGASPRRVLELAVRAAALAERRVPGRPASDPVSDPASDPASDSAPGSLPALVPGSESGSESVLARAIRAAHDTLASLPVLRAEEVAERWFPDRPQTIVPLALALATVLRSAEEAILLAANIGGDSDSVASIAGGILGAMHPDTVNRRWREVVERVNAHDLAAVAAALAPLRRGLPGAGARRP